MKILASVAVFAFSSIVIMALLALNAFWLFLLWPYAAKAVFPEAVASGTLAATLTFWQALAVTVVSNLLFKSSTSSAAPTKNG